MIQHKKLGQFILHIIKYPIITQLTSNIHFKSVKLLLNLVKYEKQYSPLGEAMISVTFKAATSQNFTLTPSTHTLSSIPIGCHAPKTNFSACSLILEFNDSLYIHCDYLLFHIFAFTNLTCFSLIIITW